MRLLVAIALCVVSMTVQAAGLTVKGITLGAPAPVSLLGRLPGSNGVLADTYFGLPAKLLVNIDQQGKVNIVTFLIQGNAFHGLAAELTQKYGKPDTDAGSFAWRQAIPKCCCYRRMSSAATRKSPLLTSVAQSWILRTRKLRGWSILGSTEGTWRLLNGQ